MGAFVNRVGITATFFPRVALCYVLALQALLAAYGTALAVGQANGPAASFVICHNAGDDTVDTGKPTTVPCALCAMAASGHGLLPAPPSVIAAPLSVEGRISHLDRPGTVHSRPARAGLARAPPQFS